MAATYLLIPLVCAFCFLHLYFGAEEVFYYRFKLAKYWKAIGRIGACLLIGILPFLYHLYVRYQVDYYTKQYQELSGYGGNYPCGTGFMGYIVVFWFLILSCVLFIFGMMIKSGVEYWRK